jgi:hypothetical protein
VSKKTSGRQLPPIKCRGLLAALGRLPYIVKKTGRRNNVMVKKLMLLCCWFVNGEFYRLKTCCKYLPAAGTVAKWVANFILMPLGVRVGTVYFCFCNFIAFIVVCAGYAGKQQCINSQYKKQHLHPANVRFTGQHIVIAAG